MCWKQLMFRLILVNLGFSLVKAKPPYKMVSYQEINILALLTYTHVFPVDHKIYILFMCFLYNFCVPQKKLVRFLFLGELPL